MKDHGKLVDHVIELLSQGLSGLSEAKIIANIRKHGLVDTAEAVQIVKDAKLKMASSPDRLQKRCEELEEETRALRIQLNDTRIRAERAEEILSRLKFVLDTINSL